MAQKRLLKELKLLTKAPASSANHQILHLYPDNSDESLLNWKCTIAKPFKTDSPYYYNGKWELEISIGPSYPNKPPHIAFSQKTPIIHPNINFSTGEICLDILKDDAWSPAWDLCHLVGAILLLLDDPEPDSPLNVDLSNLFRSDKTAFESMAQYTIWKYGTIYEGTKDLSGLKVPPSLSIEGTSEEEDTEGLSDTGEDSDRVFNGKQRGGEKQLVGQHDGEQQYEAQNEGKQQYETQSVSQNDGKQKHATRHDGETQHVTQLHHDHGAVPQLSSLQQPNATYQVKHVPEEHNRDSSVDSASLMEGPGISDKTRVPSSTAKDLHNDEYIHDLGRQVTREFLKKATEVEHSSPEHLNKSPSPLLLAAVHQHVTNNVARQIQEICSNGASNPQPAEKRTEKKPDLEKIKAVFLEQIDKQVDEIRKSQGLQQSVVQ